MNSPLLACIAFGVLVILARVPSIFWPEATVTFYREKISDTARIRLFTTIPFLLALAMVLTTSELQSWFAIIVMSLGLIVVVVCGVLVLIPN